MVHNSIEQIRPLIFQEVARGFFSWLVSYEGVREIEFKTFFHFAA